MQLSLPDWTHPKCVGGQPFYYTEGFLTLQRAIDKAYIDKLEEDRLAYELYLNNGSSVETDNTDYGNYGDYDYEDESDTSDSDTSSSSSFIPTKDKIPPFIYDMFDNVFLKRLAFGPYALDVFPMINQLFLVFLVMIAYIRLVISIAKHLVLEKETKIKEYMKTMGAKPLVQWLTWLIHFMIVACLICSLFAFLVTSEATANLSRAIVNFFVENKRKETTVAIFPFSNPILIFMVFMILCFQIINFTFFLTTFFDQASTAAGVCGFIHFISFAPWTPIAANYNKLSKIFKRMSCAIPLWGNGHSWFLISALEGRAVGLQFSNINQVVISYKTDLTVLEVFSTQIFFGILYFLLALYFDSVRPGQWGCAKPWHYPVTDLLRILLVFRFPEKF